MAGAAKFVRDGGELQRVLEAAAISGEVQQHEDGTPTYMEGLTAGIADEQRAFKTGDIVTVPKTTGIVFLPGSRVYWDRSAGKAHFKKVNDRDFYLGRAVGNNANGLAAESAATTMEVRVGVDPAYDIDLMRDPVNSTNVGTAAAGAFGYPVRLGGSHILELTATNEAQKNDLISVDGFDKDANAIVEFQYRVISDGAGSEPDVSLGVANATHASDADAITESMLIHMDGNSTTIYAESDDGVNTEIAATDTTKTYSEGSAVANRKEVWLDFRNPADVQVYVDAVHVLPSTVFNVSGATGPFFLFAHLEKTASTSTYKLAVDKMTARFSES